MENTTLATPETKMEVIVAEPVVPAAAEVTEDVVAEMAEVVSDAADVMSEAEKARAGHIQFLKDAKEALLDLEGANVQKAELEQAQKKQMKVLAAEKKAVEDTINNTIKKRKDELSRRFDGEINKVQDAIKKIQAKRDKAKKQSMKERIDTQLVPYRAENKEMNDKIKAMFKQDQVPMFCNTTLYYALYFPKMVKEVLLMMLTFLICCVGVPCGVFWMLPERKTWWLILIYLVIIVVFGGIYIAIGNITKDKHLQVLQEAGQIRHQMYKNQKKMRSIKKGIRREKTEEHYDLSSFDSELSVKAAEKAELQAKKEEALAYFVNTTKPAIIEEIRAGSHDKIAAMEQENESICAAVAEKAEYIRQVSLKFSKDYEAYIGKEFMQADKLDALAELLRSGQASSITEAENLYKQQAAAKKQ